MHTLSTTNEHNINPQSVNSQCGYHQTPLCSVSLVRRLLLFAISLLNLSFCAEPKAKSQNPSFQKIPFLRVYGGIVLKVPSPYTREVILHLKEPSLTGRVRTLAVGEGEDTIKGIF